MIVKKDRDAWRAIEHTPDNAKSLSSMVYLSFQWFPSWYFSYGSMVAIFSSRGACVSQKLPYFVNLDTFRWQFHFSLEKKHSQINKKTYSYILLIRKNRLENPILCFSQQPKRGARGKHQQNRKVRTFIPHFSFFTVTCSLLKLPLTGHVLALTARRL